MIRLVLSTWIAAAIYGFSLGWAHSDLYALRNLAKMPLLLFATATITAPSAWLVARAAGASLSFLGVQRATWTLYRDAAVLLASMAPVVFFVACDLRANATGPLGGYDAFLATNIGLVAVCGSLALARQARNLFETFHESPVRARAIVAMWLALSLLVGGQAAFYIRPFFGFPATRGGHPPFMLGSTPDLRGATNFFEAVLQTIERPGIPGY
jgi:hypothetical protein